MPQYKDLKEWAEAETDARWKPLEATVTYLATRTLPGGFAPPAPGHRPSVRRDRDGRHLRRRRERDPGTERRLWADSG